MEELCNDTTQLQKGNPKAIIWIAGYENLPDIDWEIYSVAGNTKPTPTKQYQT